VTVCPLFVRKLMPAPFRVPPEIVPASVSPGRTIPITVFVARSHPLRFGTAVVIV